MKRNAHQPHPLHHALLLGAVVLGTLLIAAPQTQQAEAGWRRAYRWSTPYYGTRYYSSWYAPTYGGYSYAAPSYYYSPPVYTYTPRYSYYPSYSYYSYPRTSYYRSYPRYGYSRSYYYGPGFGVYRTGYRGGWGFSIGF